MARLQARCDGALATDKTLQQAHHVLDQDLRAARKQSQASQQEVNSPLPTEAICGGISV